MSKTRVVHVNDNVPGAVYIGRQNGWKGLKRSKWANPVKITGDVTRTEAIERYREHLNLAWHLPELGLNDIHELAGKPLACWCRHDGEERTEENACHGDVLVELIEELGLDEGDK